MKTTDYIILIAVAAYTYLFYQELPGINFAVFNIVLIAAMVVRDSTVLSRQNWLLAAMASLSTVVCVALYGNVLSSIANIISLCVLGGFAFRPQASLLVSLLNSIYSILSWPAFVIVKKMGALGTNIEETPERPITEADAAKMGEPEAETQPVETPETKVPERYRKLAIYIFPVAVTLLFFFIYRAANPHFKELTDQIDWYFISWPLLRFVLIGTVIMCGYFLHRGIKELDKADEEASSTLHENQLKPREKGMVSSILSLDTEIRSGTMLFVLLNVLLLVVNILDIKFLWIANGLAPDADHSTAVHESVGNLILSIVLAIILILFYFRGHVNFAAKNKVIRAMAYVWILQNVFLVASTAFRNLEYIEVHNLTYKRIGVFVYLLLTLSGLLTTFIKVWAHKSNWYLFRVNGWSFFSVLVVACYFNWDVIITRYNLQQGHNVDSYYLMTLGYSNIPDILELMPEADKTQFSYKLNQKIDRFVAADLEVGWSSWSFQRQRVREYLQHQGYYEPRQQPVR